MVKEVVDERGYIDRKVVVVRIRCKREKSRDK